MMIKEDVLYPVFMLGGAPVRPMTESAFRSMLMDMSHLSEGIEIEDDDCIRDLVLYAVLNGATLSINGTVYSESGTYIIKDGFLPAHFGKFMDAAAAYYMDDPMNLLEDGCYLACYAEGVDYSDKLLELGDAL